MGFLNKAREAADRAAQQAREAADQARARVQDPTTQERMKHGVQAASQQARDAAGRTKKGLATMVDKIDPNLLADIVIKATALQERANHALREKGSPYRVAEITITATIPPQVGFTIGRVGDVEEALTGREIDSTRLVAEGDVDEGAALSLDGEVISPEELDGLDAEQPGAGGELAGEPSAETDEEPSTETHEEPALRS